jgi:phosphoribosylcarboxyaminoimidazole (NCAIR) mutase
VGVRVGVVMGSRSDWATMEAAARTLELLGVAHEVQVVSAHRTPDGPKLVVQIDGQPDTDVPGFVALAGAPAESSVVLTVDRDGERREVTVVRAPVQVDRPTAAEGGVALIPHGDLRRPEPDVRRPL